MDLKSTSCRAMMNESLLTSSTGIICGDDVMLLLQELSVSGVVRVMQSAPRDACILILSMRNSTARDFPLSAGTGRPAFGFAVAVKGRSSQ